MNGIVALPLLNIRGQPLKKVSVSPVNRINVSLKMAAINVTKADSETSYKKVFSLSMPFGAILLSTANVNGTILSN